MENRNPDTKGAKEIAQGDILTSDNGDRFKVGTFIAGGGQGSVYTGVDQQTQQVVAIKIQQFDERKTPKARELFRREKDNLFNLTQKFQKYIVNIINYGVKKRYTFIILEYCVGGSLRIYLKKNPDLTQQKKINIFKNIIIGMMGLYQSKIMHRDLKLDNILMQGDTPKIADFGQSKYIEQDIDNITMTGTDIYRAPELLRYDQKVDKFINGKSDIWSLGVLVYELFFGKYIYPNKPDSKQLFSWLEQQYKTQIDYSNTENISKEVIEILKKMLVVDVDKRITYDELFKQSIFEDQVKQYGELILDDYNPYDNEKDNYDEEQTLSIICLKKENLSVTDLSKVVQQSEEDAKYIQNVIDKYTNDINIYNLYGQIKDDLGFYENQEPLKFFLIKRQIQRLEKLQKLLSQHKDSEGPDHKEIRKEFLEHNDLKKLKTYFENTIKDYYKLLEEQVQIMTQYDYILSLDQNEQQAILNFRQDNTNIKIYLNRHLKKFFKENYNEIYDIHQAVVLIKIKGVLNLIQLFQQDRLFDMKKYLQKIQQQDLQQLKDEIKEFNDCFIDFIDVQ